MVFVSAFSILGKSFRRMPKRHPKKQTILQQIRQWAVGRCRGRIGYGDGDLGPFVKRPVFNWICGPEVRIPATEAMDDIDFGE